MTKELESPSVTYKFETPSRLGGFQILRFIYNLKSEKALQHMSVQV